MVRGRGGGYVVDTRAVTISFGEKGVGEGGGGATEEARCSRRSGGRRDGGRSAAGCPLGQKVGGMGLVGSERFFRSGIAAAVEGSEERSGAETEEE